MSNGYAPGGCGCAELADPDAALHPRCFAGEPRPNLRFAARRVDQGMADTDQVFEGGGLVAANCARIVLKKVKWQID